MAPKRRLSRGGTAMLVSQIQDEDFQRQRGEVIARMDAHPEIVSRLHSIAMSEAMLNPDQQDERDDDVFHITSGKVSAVPKAWATQRLAEASPHQLHAAALEATNAADRSMVMKIFFFVLAVLPAYPWPPEAKHKGIFKNLVLRRIAALGRLTHLAVPASGVITFGAGNGVYKLLPEDAEVKDTVEHISGIQVHRFAIVHHGVLWAGGWVCMRLSTLHGPSVHRHAAYLMPCLRQSQGQHLTYSKTSACAGTPLIGMPCFALAGAFAR